MVLHGSAARAVGSVSHENQGRLRDRLPLSAADADDPAAQRASVTHADLQTWDRVQFDPPLPANTYHDSFGNFCHVSRAPTGGLKISTDF